MDVVTTLLGGIINTASLVLPGLLNDGRTHETYHDAQVWRTPLRTQADVDLFQHLRSNGKISLWQLSRKRVDYLVQGGNRVKVREELITRGLNYSIFIPNVQKSIKASQIKPAFWTAAALRNGHRLNFDSYPSLDVINEYLDFLKKEYSSLVKVSTVGNSVENRPIKMVRVSNGKHDNKAIVLVGGHHAREWAGITSVLYILHQIVTSHADQPLYIQNIDWYILPLMNPDGYKFTEDKDRFWRKNRRQNPDYDKCLGVDLNRNYPHHWDLPHVVVHEQCKEDYAGPHALSEPETKALNNVLKSMVDKKKVPEVFLDFHTYGQFILYPWGSGGKSPHHEKLRSVAGSIQKAIYSSTQHHYKKGTPVELLYPVSGSAFDYFHSQGVTYSLAIEGRGGDYGFLLPADQIEDFGQEMFELVKVLAKAIHN